MDIGSVWEVLGRRLAYAPGCRDRYGGPVLVVPSRGEWTEEPEEDVRTTLAYLAQLIGSERPTLVLDMRHGYVKFLKVVLGVAGQVFGPRVRQAIVVKPKQFLEKTKLQINLALDGYPFPAVLVSDQKLPRHLDAETLPKELGGFLLYDHAEWMELQRTTEGFLAELEAFLRRVDGKGREEWLAGEREELEALLAHGARLVARLRPDDVVQKLRNQDHLAIANRIEAFLRKFQPPREKTPSVVVTSPGDSEGRQRALALAKELTAESPGGTLEARSLHKSAPGSALHSRTPSPSIPKKGGAKSGASPLGTPDMARRQHSPGASVQISPHLPGPDELVPTDPGVARIQQRVEKKLTNLTYDHFCLTADTVCEWVLGPGEKWLLTLHEIGESRGDAELLGKAHEELIAKAEEVLSQAFELCSIATRLIHEAQETDPSKIPSLEDRRLALDKLSKNFHARALRQRDVVDMSLKFHVIYEDMLGRMAAATEKVRLATNDVSKVDEALDREMEAALKAFDAAYPALELNGQHFITQLEVHEHNARDELITRDYSPGIVHVRECLRRMQRSRRGCDEAVAKRSSRSQDLVDLAAAEKRVTDAVKALTLQWNNLHRLTLKEDMSREELETVLKQILEIEAFARMSYNRGREGLTNYALLRRQVGRSGERERELHKDLTDAWEKFAAEFELKSSHISQQDKRLQELLACTKEVATTLNQVCTRATSEPELAKIGRESKVRGELFDAEARLLSAIGSHSPIPDRRHPPKPLQPKPLEEDPSLRKDFHNSIKELHSRTQDLVETLERPRTREASPAVDVSEVRLAKSRSQFQHAAAEWEKQQILPGWPGGGWPGEDEEDRLLRLRHPTARLVEHNYVIEHIALPPAPQPTSTLQRHWIAAHRESSDWIQLRLEEMTPGMLETGGDLEEALSLQRRHRELVARLEAKQGSVEDLLRQADALVAEQPEPEAAVYEAMADSLGKAWKELQRSLALRTSLLNEAVAFFTSVNAHGGEMDALEAHAKDGASGLTSQDQIQRMMADHEQLRQSLLDTANRAITEGQTVIGRIREMGPLSDHPERPREVAEACQRIEEVMLRLSERRRRVEMSWEDRRKALELGGRAGEVWKDVALVEEWLARAEERLAQPQDLGASELSNEVLTKELDAFFSEARRNDETLSKAHHSAEELSRRGCEEGTKLAGQTSALRQRMSAVLGGIDARRSLLLSAAHFFASASQALAVLDNLDLEMRHNAQGSLRRKAEAAMAADADMARRVAEAAGTSVREGKTLLGRMPHQDHPSANGVKAKLSELEERQRRLEASCSAAAEAAMARSRAILDLDAQHSQLHLWLLNVAESFLATYRDMGTTHPASADFQHRHKAFAADLASKAPEVEALLRKGREAEAEVGDPGLAEVARRIVDLHSRWENLRSAVQRRLELADLYTAFHKAAADLASDMDRLDSGMRSSREEAEREMEEGWAKLTQGYAATRHTGEKFIAESRAHRVDEELELRRAVLCVEALLEHLAERHRAIGTGWDAWKAEAAKSKAWAAQWTQLDRESRTLLDGLSSLDREAAGLFGHFEDTPSKVVERVQNNMGDFLPKAKLRQQELENMVRRAETMEAPASGREAKERLMSELLAANSRLTSTITWVDVLGSQLVTFFKNLVQLDDWSRRVESKFATEAAPKDAAALDDLVREHDSARHTVAQMIQFAHNEGDQIILRARQPEVPRSVQTETEKLPGLLNSRVRNWEEVWTKQHRQLSSKSSTARILREITDQLVEVKSLDDRLGDMRRQAAVSPDAARTVAEEFRSFERCVLEMDMRVRTTLSTISQRPYQGEPTVQEAGNDLRQRWDELKAKSQNFHNVLSSSASFFTLLEETESWNREVTEYVSEAEQDAERVESSAAAESLAQRVDDYSRPRLREQEDRLRRIDTAAIQLYGEEAAHKTQGQKRRYKDIVDSFVKIQERLGESAESWRQREAAQRQRDAPKFVETLRESEVLEGTRCELSCRVEGRPQPSVTWLKDGVSVAHHTDYRTYTSGTTCTLTIEETFTEDSGSFVCRATNEHGTAETQGQLRVKDDPRLRMQPPNFTRKLGQARVEAGQRVRLEAHVSGNPMPSISWYKDDVCVDEKREYDVTFNNGVCVLSMGAATEGDSGLFVCRARNPAGEAATSASVAVEERREPPTFHRYLADSSIRAGETLQLSASVTGLPKPELFWSLGSRPLNDGSAQLAYDGREAHMAIERATTNCDGTYRLVARNSAGEAVSSCRVSVVDVEANRPRFVQTLRDITVQEGSTVRLDAVVSGAPAPDVRWVRDDAPLIQTDRLRVIAEAPHHSLFLPSAHLSQTGLYKVEARSELGEASSICRLTVTKKPEPPRLMPTLQSQTLTVGNRLMLEARAVGDPPPRVQWFHNDRELQSTSRLQLLDDGEWKRLVIPRIEVSDHGDYTLLATNDGGEARSICNLAVAQPPPPAPAPRPQPPPQPQPPPPQPAYHTQRTEVVEEYSSESHMSNPHGTPPQFKLFFPSSHRAALGSRVKMECHLVGNPRPKVTWTFNGRPIPPNLVQLSNIGDTYAIIIPEAGPEHQGTYSLRGVNEMGSAESSVNLLLTASAIPPPYRDRQRFPHWIRRGNFMRTEEDSRSSQWQSEMESRETRTLVSRPDTAAPHFTQTLVSVVASEAEDITFSANVTGKPMPEVSWSKDGRPLFEGGGVSFENRGGQIRLHVREARAEHSGKYVCTARNSSGFATSSAQLIVRPRTDAPDFVERLISREVGEGESLRWTVEITGVPPPTVTWLRNGAVIPHCADVQLVDEGRGRHSLVIPRAELVDGGQFTVRAENVAGEARSTADLVIRPKGTAPGKYYHVTKVTQEQQELGMEVSSNAHFDQRSSRSSSRHL